MVVLSITVDAPMQSIF